MSSGYYIITILVLILMSAYFSATETAFSSLNKTRLKALAEKGNKRAQLAFDLSEQYDKLISTILIGNNIVNITMATLGTILFVKLLGDIGATVSSVVITVLVLIFGEISPKSIAKDCPERFAMFSSPIIRVFIWLLTPLNFLFSNWKILLSKILKIEESSKMSQEELIMLVEEVEQDGSIDTDESDIIKNAIEFTEQKAGDILTHRVDLEAVPETADKSEIAKLFQETQFSRLLVYRESIDNIIGVIHLKDFFSDKGITERSVQSLLKKPLFIQKHEKVSDLLKKLQKCKSHIAVVIDEYGGTLGIVTMEDILEELVGEIWDEHDEVVESFKRLSDNVYLVDPTASMDSFCDFFDMDIETESVSVSGWVMETMEKVPEDGDSFSFKKLDITITGTDSHRITDIEVVVKEEVTA